MTKLSDAALLTAALLVNGGCVLAAAFALTFFGL